MTEGWKRAMRLLWPDRCIFCGGAAPGGQPVCPRCQRQLPLVGQGMCVVCGHPREGCVCHSGDPNPAVWYAAALWYVGGVRRALGEFKFRGRREAGAYFAALMVEAIREQIGETPEIDLITCVPMHPERQRQRGYNQAEVLAEELSRLLAGGCRPGLLRRDSLFIQHTLSGRFRRVGARDSFLVTDEEQVRGRRILLVDDICTTGSTLRECAWALKDAGAIQIFCITAALGRVQNG